MCAQLVQSSVVGSYPFVLVLSLPVCGGKHALCEGTHRHGAANCLGGSRFRPSAEPGLCGRWGRHYLPMWSDGEG